VSWVILLDGRGTLDFDGYDGKYVVVVKLVAGPRLERRRRGSGPHLHRDARFHQGWSVPVTIRAGWPVQPILLSPEDRNNRAKDQRRYNGCSQDQKDILRAET
jgi:hypothetical protein